MKFAPDFSKLITVIGAGVILLTFVIKDVVSQQYKDASGAIDRIAGSYRQNAYSILFQSSLASVREEFGISLASLQYSKSNPSQELILKLETTTQGVKDHTQVLLETAFNISAIAGDIKLDDQLNINILQFRQRSLEISSKAQKFADQLPNIIANIQTYGSSKSSDLLSFSQNKDADIFLINIATFALEIQSAQNSSGSLVNEINVYLEKIRAEININYQIFTRISYVLFAAGWLVGLIGQLLRK